MKTRERFIVDESDITPADLAEEFSISTDRVRSAVRKVVGKTSIVGRGQAYIWTSDSPELKAIREELAKRTTKAAKKVA